MPLHIFFIFIINWQYTRHPPGNTVEHQVAGGHCLSRQTPPHGDVGVSNGQSPSKSLRARFGIGQWFLTSAPPKLENQWKVN